MVGKEGERPSLTGNQSVRLTPVSVAGTVPTAKKELTLHLSS